MLKKLAMAFLILLLPQSLLAYQQAMLSLRVPSVLEAGEGEFRILHRFTGVFHDRAFDTALGMTEGAFANFGLSYGFWKKFQAGVSYLTRYREILAGARYAYFLPAAFLRAEFGAELSSFDLGSGRENNFFGLLSLQSEPILKRVTPVLNLGYDGHNHRFGVGVGVNIILIKKFELIGEYYPLYRDDSNPNLKPKNAFAFGIKDNTAGHHFMLLFTNSYDSDPRRLMLGTRTQSDSDLFFGFNIERHIDIEEFLPGGEE